MRTVLVMLVIAAAGYGLLSYHFVLFDGSLQILKKTSAHYQNTFVDARGNRKLELALKPDLIAAGIDDVVNRFDQSIERVTNQ